MEQKIQANVDETKLIRAIGKWMIIIAIVILCINTFCRLVDAEKSKEHVQVSGTVSKVHVSSEWVRAGNRMVNASTYTVWVRFRPAGWLSEDVIVNDYNDNIFSVGDTVTVLYPKNAIWKAYAAKKDWLTGAYLPVSKDYNLPLILSIILFVVGLLFFKNSPILDWIVGMGETAKDKKENGTETKVISEQEMFRNNWLSVVISIFLVGILLGVVALLVFLSGNEASAVGLALLDFLIMVVGIYLYCWYREKYKK